MMNTIHVRAFIGFLVYNELFNVFRSPMAQLSRFFHPFSVTAPLFLTSCNFMHFTTCH